MDLELEEEKKKVDGTPRFANDIEIHDEEIKFLLSFAFKNAQAIEEYRRQMNFIIHTNPTITEIQKELI
jgi:hypothetical protein